MTGRLDGLCALLTAVNLAKAGASAIDDEIGRLIDPFEGRCINQRQASEALVRTRSAPLFSSNIDAAIALAVQVTGARSWALSYGRCSETEAFSAAFLYADETGQRLIAEGEAATPALAICAAAIIAEIEKEGGG
jgi:hypothetical protein